MLSTSARRRARKRRRCPPAAHHRRPIPNSPAPTRRISRPGLCATKANSPSAASSPNRPPDSALFVLLFLLLAIDALHLFAAVVLVGIMARWQRDKRDSRSG